MRFSQKVPTSHGTPNQPRSPQDRCHDSEPACGQKANEPQLDYPSRECRALRVFLAVRVVLTMKLLPASLSLLSGLVSALDSIEDIASIDLPEGCSGASEVGEDGRLRCSTASTKPWLAATGNASSGLRWEDPSDCLGEACVFVDPNFAGGVVAITTTSNAKRMAENLDVFGFALTEDEMKRIAARKRPDGRIADPAGRAPAWD